MVFGVLRRREMSDAEVSPFSLRKPTMLSDVQRFNFIIHYITIFLRRV